MHQVWRTRDGNPALKRVSGYPLSTSQYRPGFYRASLCLPSFLSWGWPHRGARTDSDTSGLLLIEFLVLCVAAVHNLFYEASFQDGVPIYLLLGDPGYGVPAGQRLMSYQ